MDTRSEQEAKGSERWFFGACAGAGVLVFLGGIVIIAFGPLKIGVVVAVCGFCFAGLSAAIATGE